jgi:hypothetical protein
VGGAHVRWTGEEFVELAIEEEFPLFTTWELPPIKVDVVLTVTGTTI